MANQLDLSHAIDIPFEDFADGLTFGESPRYRDGKLMVSDMMGCKLHEFDTRSRKPTAAVVAEDEDSFNGSGFLPDGTFVYSSQLGQKLYTLREGKSELYADLTHLMTGYCGDMIIDDDGCIYQDDSGCRPWEGDMTTPGRIIAVKPDRSSSIVAEGLRFPNGLVLDSKQTTLYVAETQSNSLTAFDITASGQLENRRTILDLTPFSDSSQEGYIDGICIDSDDGIWLSLIHQGLVVRRSASGDVTHVIRTGHLPTAVTLGGDDGRTLFIVVNAEPEGMEFFDTMRNKLTTGSIKTARVPFGRRVPPIHS